MSLGEPGITLGTVILPLKPHCPEAELLQPAFCVNSSHHRYASFLMGISRGFGLIAGIVSSTATGFLISQVGHVIKSLQVLL